MNTTPDRKALAKELAAEIGADVRYLGVPSCAYQVGPYTINKDASISGGDLGAIRDFLIRHNCIRQEPDAPVEEQNEAAADSKATPVMEISVPAPQITPLQLKNLIFLLHSRQTLINRMTQGDCLNIPDILIDRIKECTPENLDDLTGLLDDSKAVAGLTGFDCRDGKVSMTFPFDEKEPTKWTACANLLNRIFDAAMKATRVSPERVEPDAQNEKYLAHTWLQRLGYAGADSKAERKILLGHLTGYCAFADRDKMQVHMEKYTARRRERRIAEQEAAVLEVMAEEGDGNA